MSEPEELGRLLSERNETIAVAETTSGGLICARIVSVPGSSAYFDRGVVAYSKVSKIESLGVEACELDRFGAVSPETAGLLATAVRDLAKTTYGLAETGIAGPIRGRSPKPVGSACIAVCGPSGPLSLSCTFAGDRQEIRRQIAERALETAASYVENMGVLP